MNTSPEAATKGQGEKTGEETALPMTVDFRRKKESTTAVCLGDIANTEEKRWGKEVSRTKVGTWKGGVGTILEKDRLTAGKRTGRVEREKKGRNAGGRQRRTHWASNRP